MMFCNPPDCPSPFFVVLSHNTLECIVCHKRVKIDVQNGQPLLIDIGEIKKDYYTVSDESIENELFSCGYKKIMNVTISKKESEKEFVDLINADSEID